MGIIMGICKASAEKFEVTYYMITDDEQII